jgi:hypothetical protein
VRFTAMKFAAVCLFVVVADNIDVDQILHNDRLLNRYVDCLLEKSKGRCPPEAVELKSEYHAVIKF